MSRRQLIDLTQGTPSSLVTVDLTTPNVNTPANGTPVANPVVDPIILFGEILGDDRPRQRRRLNNIEELPVLLEGEYLNVEWPPVLNHDHVPILADGAIPHPIASTEQEMVAQLREINVLREVGALETRRFNGSHPMRNRIMNLAPNQMDNRIYARWGYIFLHRLPTGQLQWFQPMPVFFNVDDDQYYIDLGFERDLAYMGIHIDDARQFFYMDTARHRNTRIVEVPLRHLNHN